MVCKVAETECLVFSPVDFLMAHGAYRELFAIEGSQEGVHSSGASFPHGANMADMMHFRSACVSADTAWFS